MSRGTCYGIMQSVDDALSFDPYSIMDLAGNEFDYVGEDNSPDDIEYLVNWLKNNGANVFVSLVDGEQVFSFEMTEDIKRNCFRSQYEEFKKMAEAITLDEFALKDPYKLRQLVEDPFSDAVYSYSMGFQPIDRWLRESGVGITYYFARAFLIH